MSWHNVIIAGVVVTLLCIFWVLLRIKKHIAAVHHESEELRKTVQYEMRRAPDCRICKFRQICPRVS